MYAWIQAADPMILLWLVLLIVFVIVEMITVGLTSIWFAAGALAALLATVLGANPIIQVVLFIVVSIALLFVTRPFAHRIINSNVQRTNADSLVGEHIRVLERVSNTDQTGRAVVRGQEWTVRAEDDKEVLEEGNMAEVVSISGVKLIVKRISG